MKSYLQTSDIEEGEPCDIPLIRDPDMEEGEPCQAPCPHEEEASLILLSLWSGNDGCCLRLALAAIYD